ncbi:hypothetical protein GN958_ATG05036 [Phytophthora infestans]|uniref:FAR1 domain-containing protein n=1 Tax=Phytophthora infestans TaxID=4787 RepID=A0A8S9V3K2_PHYIN|nr:hypothetical protein GN958_ATG05036 [Phytophthora infestans]
MPRRHARAPKRSNEASVCEASSSSDSDSAAEASRSSLHQRAPTRKKKRPSTHISRRRSRSGGKLPKRRKGDQKKRRSRSHSRGMSSDVSGSDAISTNDSPESSGASESDTTSGNNATVSNRGSGDGGIVTRDDLVHVSKIDVKMFDDWKTREAGQGLRPIQHSRKSGVLLRLTHMYEKLGNWEVCITGQKTGHNHDFSQEIYQTYHEARNVPEDEVISTIRALHRAGASRKRILEYITESDEGCTKCAPFRGLV